MRTRLGVVPGKGSQRYSAVGPVGSTARGAYSLPTISSRWSNFNTFREYVADDPRIYRGNQPPNIIQAPNGEGGAPGNPPPGWNLNTSGGASIVRADSTGIYIRFTNPLVAGATVHSIIGVPTPDNALNDYTYEVTLVDGTVDPGADLRFRPGPTNTAGDDVVIPTLVKGVPVVLSATKSFANSSNYIGFRHIVPASLSIDMTLRFAKVSIRRSALGTRRGVLIEPSQLNYVPNPRAEGGGAGVIPPTWSIQGLDSGMTLAWQAQKVVDGVTYQPVRITGTPASNLICRIVFVQTVTGTAANGLMGSVFAALGGGSLTGISAILLRIPNGTPSTYPIALSATPQRYNGFFSYAADTINQALQFHIGGVAGTPVDVTIDLAMPNLVDGDMLTMPILPPLGQLVAFTRGLAKVTMPLVGLTIPQGGTLVFEGTVWAQSVQLQGLIALDDNTFNNRLFLYINGATNQVVVNVFNGGANTAFLGIGAITFGQPFKVAVSFTPAGVKLSLNGGAVTTIPCVVPVPAFTIMSVGSLGVTGSLPMNGAVAEGRYIQGPTTDAVLQLMSA